MPVLFIGIAIGIVIGIAIDRFLMKATPWLLSHGWR